MFLSYVHPFDLNEVRTGLNADGRILCEKGRHIIYDESPVSFINVRDNYGIRKFSDIIDGI